MSIVRLTLHALLAVSVIVATSRYVRGEDGPLYFPTVDIPAPIKPTPIRNLPESPDSSKPREVILYVPNFPCGACQYLESQIATVPGVRLRKVVDMNRTSWPWLSVPDTGHEWGYYHPVTNRPLTAKDLAAILKAFPPTEKPAKRGAK